MRALTGFSIIFITFIFFIFILFHANTELKSANSLPEVLDDKIPIETVSLNQTSFIKDSMGKVISDIHQSENRIVLPFDEIPQIVKELFISIEDQHFYEHIGFDITGIGRAALINLQSESIEQGGSTITQQLSRNLFLTTEKTYNRKLSELLYSYQLERRLSKDQILALYINAIYYQNGVYGIEAASRYYFNQSIKNASLAKIAFLSAIPNNPTVYNPITHFENTKKRQERILTNLLNEKVITKDQYDIAFKEPIKLKISTGPDLYPDYSTYIMNEFEELIWTQEGYYQILEQEKDTNERKKLQKKFDEKVKSVLTSGVIIETALDPTIQNAAVQSVKTRLPYHDIQGAAAVIDHTSNQLVAIVGGKDYQKYSFHRGYQAFRQPGSSIKPLLVYAPYFDKTGASVSKMINANNFCKNGYCPKNYGGGQYGYVSLKTALKNSYNTPAVRLLDDLGVQTAFSYLQKLQFSKVVPADQSLPAALGGFSYGMSPLEMTNAFTTFSNDGKFIRAHGIKRVTDLNGNTLYEWHDEPIQAWSQAANQKMRSILHEVVTTGTGKKANFQTSYIGGKTGTTNNVKDLWFIGMTSNYTAGVWIGNDESKSIRKVERIKPQIQIWRDIMKKASE
ncbi:transglycosylase domain-containing protein [Ferdinandcohnia quinoae]|uniref:Penicillin-binding protein n=1 Tax=Fredinandcohnia quinoae TaxID=2918902 RepID=A0AAW5DXV4_9BACI|nr:transglycosylase domain-containing protein [Fredinandcohnia sp. SECRCQ15]MCH1625500.1 penicillin-binding protein [Fredinandcohnia sp. SECRCQ15]